MLHYDGHVTEKPSEQTVLDIIGSDKGKSTGISCFYVNPNLRLFNLW